MVPGIPPVASSIGKVSLSYITIGGRLFPMAFKQANTVICALFPVQYANGFFVPLSNTPFGGFGFKGKPLSSKLKIWSGFPANHILVTWPQVNQSNCLLLPHR